MAPSPPNRRIPPLRPETETVDDERARRELDAFSERALEEASRASEHGRVESLRAVVHVLVLASIYAIGAIYICAILTVAWNTLMPDRWHWLTDDEARLVTAAVVSSVVTSFAGTYIRTRVR